MADFVQPGYYGGSTSDSYVTSAQKVLTQLPGNGKPQASDYTMGTYNPGNMFERMVDWMSGHDRKYDYETGQSLLDKQFELDANEYLDSTKYQRLVNDLKAAGLNPWLALNGGGMTATSQSVSGSGQSRSSNQKSGNNGFIGSALKIGMLIKILASIV